MTKRIPINAAKAIADKYDQHQVIILTWDKANGLTHVVTYGVTVKDCQQAALGAEKLRVVLGLTPQHPFSPAHVPGP